MFDVVKIGDKDVPMLAMASVDVFYRNIFHKDPLTEQTQLQNEGDAIAFYERVGFVMAKYAESKDRAVMKMLTEDDFTEWLEQFGRFDLINALGRIQAVYDGQSVTNADAKKNTDEPSDK